MSWQKIETRPENAGYTLVRFKSGNVAIMRLGIDAFHSTTWYHTTGYFTLEQATHWHPIPEFKD